MQELCNLIGLCVTEGLASLVERLDRFDECLCEPIMCLFGATNNRELIGACDALVTVLIVETDAQEMYQFASLLTHLM